MEIFYKIAIGGILAVILAISLKSQSRELAPVLSLAACAVLLLSGVPMLRNVLDYLYGLRDSVGLSSAIFSPLVKVCGICILVQVSSTFCMEAGEGAIGKIVELCGSAAAVCAMLPLLDSIIDLVKQLLGG